MHQRIYCGFDQESYSFVTCSSRNPLVFFELYKSTKMIMRDLLSIPEGVHDAKALCGY